MFHHQQSIIKTMPGIILLRITAALYNWRPAGHNRPETTCSQAREIIY
jgi:hypothetical protein